MELDWIGWEKNLTKSRQTKANLLKSCSLAQFNLEQHKSTVEFQNSSLGLSWTRLGSLLECLGHVLEALWSVLGAFWSLPKRSWNLLGISWEPLGNFLGASWGPKIVPGRPREPSRAHLAPKSRKSLFGPTVLDPKRYKKGDKKHQNCFRNACKI